MNKKIIFQKCKFDYIYFLLYAIAYAIMQILDHSTDIDDYLKENPGKNEDNNHFELSKQLIIAYSSNTADFLAIIPYFIRKRLIKKSNVCSKKIETSEIDDKVNESKGQNELIYNDIQISEAQKRKKILIIFCVLVGIFDFMKEFIEILNYIISKKQDFDIYPFSFTVIFNIVLQFICSYLLLKGNFYKLQFFSLFLNFGIYVIILIIDLCNYFLVKDSFERQMFILFPLYLLFYCLESIYGKKVILYAYISIYLLIVIKGVIKLILLILLSIILVIVNRDYFEVIPFFFKHTKYILLVISYVILHFFFKLFFWIIIDKFSPNHTPLILLLEEVVDFIISAIENKGKFEEEYKIMGWDIYFRMFLYLISFIGVLIHNEIIVTNICGLGSDTKYFLDLEVKKEEEYINADNLDDLKKFETITEMEEQSNDTSSNEDENKINN